MRRRGQTLVLACITMMVLALMLMMTFNLTNAIHEKIRIQNHADAQAYSIAVVEARAYNSIAFSNRAIAAALVAQMSLHAWYAIANQATKIHEGLSTAFIIVAIMEIIEGLASWPPCVNVHCLQHAPTAFSISAQHSQKGQDIGQKIQGMESDFNDAVDDLSGMIKDLHSEQNSVVSQASDNIKSSGSMLSSLKQTNAPASNYDTTVDSKNTGNFTCPLEGASAGGSGGDCSGSTKSKEDRSKIMAAVANGTRPDFDNGGASVFLTNAGSDFQFVGSSYLNDIQQNTGMYLTYFGVQAAVGEDKSGSANDGDQLKEVSAGTTGGFVFVTWNEGIGFGGGNANIASDKDSGEHNAAYNAHTGTHNKYPGCVEEDCFINFKLGSKNSDFNQPSTYGAVSQSLRWTPNGQAPWEVNSEGTVKMNLGEAGEMSLKLVPEKDGKAIAKGKVYFHQLGDWTVPPNLFDPFWRAKLHPFTDRADMNKAAGSGGDNFEGPVEGKQ